MKQDCDRNVLHVSYGRRWGIKIARTEELQDPNDYLVLLAGVLPPDIIQARYMTLWTLRSLALHVSQAIARMEKAQIDPASTPDYPKAKCATIAHESSYRMTLACSRLASGALESVLSIYDVDDPVTPTLIAMGRDEIQSLHRDCENAIVAVTRRRVSRSATP